MGVSVDEIVSRCRSALGEHTPQLAVRDVLDELVADPSALAGALPRFDEGGLQVLHHTPDLTVLHIAWTPGISLYPHEHGMWAVIGMYNGQEDNVFYRRSSGTIVESGGKSIVGGDVLLMGDDAIHAVRNPRREFALALHVYGGDFFEGQRSEWDAETFEERPRDIERTRRLFDQANREWRDALPREQ